MLIRGEYRKILTPVYKQLDLYSTVSCHINKCQSLILKIVDGFLNRRLRVVWKLSFTKDMCESNNFFLRRKFTLEHWDNLKLVITKQKLLEFKRERIVAEDSATFAL